MGVARAPVTGSGLWPACRLSVSNCRDRGAAMMSSSEVRRILAGHMVCHSRASGNPATLSGSHWVPASAGTTAEIKTAPRRGAVPSSIRCSAQLDRHVDLVAFALYQERDRPARPVDEPAQLIGGFHGLVVEGEYHV